MGVTPLRASALMAVLCVASLAAGCGRREGWSFVESVGGIAVGTPRQTAQVWVLPVDANVSGVSRITVSPTTQNSALTCRIRTAVKNHNLYITLVAGLFGSGAKCPPALLGPMKAGKYVVLYAGPGEPTHLIGSMVIPPSSSAAMPTSN
jgi:hypothetical protein